ncbi:MAG TPA: hypothetical protein V6C57_24960 [Coleofasciculaceae cyanobacterium]
MSNSRIESLTFEEYCAASGGPFDRLNHHKPPHPQTDSSAGAIAPAGML